MSPLLCSYTAHLRSEYLHLQLLNLTRELQDRKRAAHKVLDIQELLENIFKFLPGKDLFRFQQVCPRWQQTITGPVEFQSLIWRHPKISTAVDAHFPLVAVPAPPDALSRLHRCQEAFIESEGTRRYFRQYRNTRVALGRYIQSSIMRPNGWDAESLEPVCISCGCCHGQIFVDNIHPLFQWLATTTWVNICISGQRSWIFIELESIRDNLYIDIERSWGARENIRRQKLLFRNKLDDVAASMYRHGRENDMFTTPACTVLVGGDGHWRGGQVIRNQRGVSVENAANLLGGLFRLYIDE